MKVFITFYGTVPGVTTSNVPKETFRANVGHLNLQMLDKGDFRRTLPCSASAQGFLLVLRWMTHYRVSVFRGGLPVTFEAL